MADVSRATTPITNRNIIQPTKEHRDSAKVPFDFQDTSKVKQTTSQSEMLGQNNVYKENQTATGYLDILRDPDISSVFLKNIYLLREIVGILPMTNETQTEEMQTLLNDLVLNPEEIVGEMMRQEDISTIFKGGLFDMLRNMVAQNQGSEVEAAVVALLKSLNNDSSKESILESLRNNLTYLSDELSVSTSLSDKLAQLISQLDKQVTGNIASAEQKLFSADLQGSNAQPNEAEALFSQLKNSILDVFKDIEQSVLYSDDIAKTVSMATYNLSRVNTSDTQVADAFSKLLNLLDNDGDKENLAKQLLSFIDNSGHVGGSKTMNALTTLLQKQCESSELKVLNADSMDKIIHSLLSAPCNFTPLLHYVIPVEYEDVQASAEMWINPNGEDDVEADTGDKKITHMLIVFEIEGIGKFETELYVDNKNIDLSILCPEEYTDYYKSTTADIRKNLSFSDYKFKKIVVSELKESRSLIEVFKSLPLRRAGVNVTI